MIDMEMKYKEAIDELVRRALEKYGDKKKQKTVIEDAEKY